MHHLSIVTWVASTVASSTSCWALFVDAAASARACCASANSTGSRAWLTCGQRQWMQCSLIYSQVPPVTCSTQACAPVMSIIEAALTAVTNQMMPVSRLSNPRTCTEAEPCLPITRPTCAAQHCSWRRAASSSCQSSCRCRAAASAASQYPRSRAACCASSCSATDEAPLAAV